MRAHGRPIYRPSFLPRLLLLLPSLLFIPHTHSILINKIVDDQSPLLAYSSNWNRIDSKNPCSGCTVILRHPEELQNGTYHDTTANRKGVDPVSTVSLQFTGSAIYAQGVIPGNDHPGIERLDAEYYFFLDGIQTGTYIQSAPNLTDISDDGYLYNVTIYANSTLEYGSHNFTIRAGRSGGPEALLLLDSLIFTQEDGTNPSESTTSTTSPSPTQIAAPASTMNSQTIIIMAVVIPIMVLGLLLIAFIVICRRRRRRENHSSVWGTGPRPIPISYTTDSLTDSSIALYQTSGMSMDAMSQTGSWTQSELSATGGREPPSYESLWRDNVRRAIDSVGRQHSNNTNTKGR